jgi:hypothetical protein
VHGSCILHAFRYGHDCSCSMLALACIRFRSISSDHLEGRVEARRSQAHRDQFPQTNSNGYFKRTVVVLPSNSR